jgi:hypothetical protein
VGSICDRYYPFFVLNLLSATEYDSDLGAIETVSTAARL